MRSPLDTFDQICVYEKMPNHLNVHIAKNISNVEIQGRSSLADFIVIACGNSSRHLRSMAEYLALELKQRGMPPLGVEGEGEGEWVLVDTGDIIVHLMLPRVRDFYNLEKLWDVPRMHEAAPQP